MARFLWTQKEDIGPSKRVGHCLTYDEARGRTLLFGGDPLTGPLLGDSWGWDGEFWTQAADTGPSPRRDHAMAFDAPRGAVLLFGGFDGTSSLRDSWSWNGENWTQVEDTGPSARRGHAMAFDQARGRVVLFGGDDGQALQDTWEWDGTGWTQVEDTGPSPRRNAAMAYDLVHQKTVLFGGDKGDGTALADTWAWDGQAWTQIADIGPPACLRAAMVSTDAQLVLFGGLDGTNAQPPPKLFDDSWTFDGALWTQRQDIGPAGRWGHGMAFDVTRRTIVMFGGHSSATFSQVADLLGDTWEHAETEQSGTGGGGGGAGGDAMIAELMLTPNSVMVGELVNADVSLTAPSQVDVPVQIWGVRQSVYQAANGDPSLVPPEEFFQLGDFQIPAGMPSGNTSFAAPDVGESIVVIAAGQAGYAQADLTIT